MRRAETKAGELVLNNRDWKQLVRRFSPRNLKWDKEHENWVCGVSCICKFYTPPGLFYLFNTGCTGCPFKEFGSRYQTGCIRWLRMVFGFRTTKELNLCMDYYTTDTEKGKQYAKKLHDFFLSMEVVPYKRSKRNV